MKTVEEIESIMKFFLNHQSKKGQPLVLLPTFYHTVGVKKGSLKDLHEILPIFREVLGEEYIREYISKFENKPINVNDYGDIAGGYDFVFQFHVNHIIRLRTSTFLEISVEIEPGGEVTLMDNGETYSFKELYESDEQTWDEVKMEINDLIIEILRYELTDYTGIHDISTEKITFF